MIEAVLPTIIQHETMHRHIVIIQRPLNPNAVKAAAFTCSMTFVKVTAKSTDSGAMTCGLCLAGMYDYDRGVQFHAHNNHPKYN